MSARTIPALLTVCVLCALTVAALAYSVRKPEPAVEIRDDRPKPTVKMTERFGPDLGLRPGEEVIETR
jgi:hypothetical protein